MPITGKPSLIAWSITLQIFAAWVSDNEPPNTVKSCEYTNTGRPFINPLPVTTPSPGILCSSMSKSIHLCSTNISHSSKLSGSSNSAIRSLAVSFPLACCLSILACPPPSRASARFCSSISVFVCTNKLLRF